MSLLGASINDLDTPALCVDLDAMEANIRELAATCRQRGVGWRPHAKCHKSIDVAHKLISAGAMGLTCAKLGEAEIFAAAGIKDLLIANELVGPQKVKRLVELRRLADPVFCIDHLDQARPISEAMQAAGLRVRAVLEINIGMNRAGILPGEPALALAKEVSSLPGIDSSGVMAWEGHLLLIEDPAEKESRIRAALTQLTATRDLLVANGLPCPIVSCGGTGSFPISVTHPGVTEIEAGGAIFMDAFYRRKCHISAFQLALKVVATVVSRPAPERAIIDAGRKTMNMEMAMPFVVGREDIEVKSLSAEHGTLILAPSAQNLRIGDRLEIIPGYSDFTNVLHNQFYALRGTRIEAIWPLQGRGKLA
ncbi:MAG: DSD1 family PLP-dependent enzyme [Planctomycetales bacterium]|nr:DSD1 family PLP-dependent enzyme [Planctomycetales bacterium]